MPVIDSDVERRSLDNHRMLTYSSAVIVLISFRHCNPTVTFRMNVTKAGAENATGSGNLLTSQPYEWGSLRSKRFSATYRWA
jgi:hypothetical protein